MKKAADQHNGVDYREHSGKEWTTTTVKPRLQMPELEQNQVKIGACREDCHYLEKSERVTSTADHADHALLVSGRNVIHLLHQTNVQGTRPA